MSTKQSLVREAQRLQKNAETRRRQATRLAGENHILRSLLVDVLAAGSDEWMALNVRREITEVLLRNHKQPSALDIGVKEHRLRLVEKYRGGVAV